MPQRCTVCAHADTKKIDEEILQGIAHTTIADNHDLHHLAIRRHAKNHLKEKLARAMKNDLDHGTDILGRFNEMLDDVTEIRQKAKKDGNDKLLLDAAQREQSAYKFLAQLQVEARKYQAHDDEAEDQQLTRQVQKGLQSLTTPELKLFIQLIAKIKTADPNYVLDADTQEFIQSVDRIFYNQSNQHNTTPAGHYDPAHPSKESNGQDQSHKRSKRSNSSLTRTKSPRTADEDPKNTKNQDVEMIDDLDMDWDDLDIEEDNTIPSEETDPDWFK